jgi:hypothetical protein
MLGWASNALGKAICQLLGKPIIGKVNYWESQLLENHMIVFAADNGFCGWW